VTTEEEHDELLIQAGVAALELGLAWVRFWAAVNALGRANMRDLVEPE